MSTASIRGRHAVACAAALGASAFILSISIAPWNGASAQAWKAEWDRTVAAAKTEGRVVLLIPPNRSGRAYLQKAWPKAYPEIKLSLTTMRSTQFVQRVKTERAAGKYLWDAALTGSGVGFQLRDAGSLDPVLPEFIFPDLKDPKTWGGWDQAFFDTDRKYVFTIRSFLKMPFYNAKLLPPEKVKALGSKIFLDPALKKKFIWHEPLIGGSGRTFSLVMHRLLGDAGFKKFLKEQVVIVRSMSDVVQKMARGEYAVSLGPTMGGVLRRYRKAGMDIDIRPLGNTPEYGAYGNTGGSSLLVLKNRPHPNAVRVWINWVLSKPVAAGMAKAMEEDSRRTDVPSVVPPSRAPASGVRYVEPQREELEPLNHKSQMFIKRVRSGGA